MSTITKFAELSRTISFADPYRRLPAAIFWLAVSP